VSSTWTVVRQDWTNYVNGLWPSFTQRRSANIGSYWNVVTNTWTAGRLTTVVDETGLSRTLTYDSVGRLQSDTRASATYGSTTIAAQTFTAAYDAAGRLLSRTTTATTVSGTETLGTAATYDTAGRLLTQSESGRGTTSFVYDVANRIVTATLPTGATRIETRFADGRIASVTGTAQVAEYYDYSVETDGRRKSTFGPATSNHVRTLSAWTDRLGRPLQRSRPGFNNAATYTESMGYDAATGRMNALSRTGYADMRFDSNGVGELTRRGLWVSGGTGLQTASADRITDLDASVESYGGAYWLTSTTKGYATVSNSTATLVETTRQRLTGLSPTLRAETRTTDADGNETIRTVTVNASSPLVTVTTTRTGATNAAIEFSLAGFAISSTGFDGVTTTSAYDSLGRRTSTTDPRTGTSTTHYQANTPLVDYVKDAANNQTATYTYDSAGRVTAVSDVAGKLTRTAYNTRNQVIRQWGAAAMPVEYAYNTLGERTAMRTIRSGDFTGSSWPLGDSGLDGTTGTPDPSV
jgi:YD repeat-containing protein